MRRTRSGFVTAQLVQATLLFSALCNIMWTCKNTMAVSLYNMKGQKYTNGKEVELTLTCGSERIYFSSSTSRMKSWETLTFNSVMTWMTNCWVAVNSIKVGFSSSIRLWSFKCYQCAKKITRYYRYYYYYYYYSCTHFSEISQYWRKV